MSHTDNRMQAHWPETREFIKATWHKFTDVQLDRINGDYDKFFEYYNEFYNEFPAGEAKVRDIFRQFFNKLDQDKFKNK